MTKAELIEEVSRVVEMTRKDSEVIVEAIFDSIVRSLRSGDKIEIRGFGSFRTRQRQPRVGRNPKTGTRVEVPSKRIPYFKPSKELKDLVNNSSDESASRGSRCFGAFRERAAQLLAHQVPHLWTASGVPGAIGTSKATATTRGAASFAAWPLRITTRAILSFTAATAILSFSIFIPTPPAT